MNNKEITFSVVIPTFNRPKQLQDTLQGLVQSDFSKDDFEVIVVDDGGDTSLEEIVALFKTHYSIRLLRQENAGPATARNTGAHRAQGKFIAFTDDDCIPSPQWLTQLYEVLKMYPDTLVGGSTENICPEFFSRCSQLIIDMVYRHFNAHHDDGQFFASNNMAAHRRLFLELGAFNEGFRTSEDRELCDRWRSHLFRLRYVPEAKIQHAHKLSAKEFCRQHFHYGRGAWKFHALRRQRRSGSLRSDMKFHANIRNLFESFKEVPLTQIPHLIGGLMLWQISNAMGFFWQALHPKK